MIGRAAWQRGQTAHQSLIRRRLLQALGMAGLGVASLGSGPCGSCWDEPEVQCFTIAEIDRWRSATAVDGGTRRAGCPNLEELAHFAYATNREKPDELEPADAAGTCCYRYMLNVCAGGRPFLIDGRPRVAVVTFDDVFWTPRIACGTTASSALRTLEALALGPPSANHSSLVRRTDPMPRVDRLSTDARERLADRWTETALMEHASIAAFARFTIQLIELGAPRRLIALSDAAMADEALHAELAFGLASAYAGRRIGAGAIDVRRALVASSLEEIVLMTLHEGCIGETLAALEAAEARDQADDPAERQVLARIARDEARHAELAWRFVDWAIEVGGDKVRRLVAREFLGLEGGAEDSCSRAA